MKIVVAGIMGRHPYGGVQWCSLMYLEGLRRLGHDVWYLEDTGECNFDPEANALATDPRYALRTIVSHTRSRRARGPMVLHRLHGTTPRHDRGAVAEHVRQHRPVPQPVGR